MSPDTVYWSVGVWAALCWLAHSLTPSANVGARVTGIQDDDLAISVPTFPLSHSPLWDRSLVWVKLPAGPTGSPLGVWAQLQAHLD